MATCSTVAIVGASARAAAFSVLRAGKQAVAADLFADVDLARQCSVERISLYPEGLVDWLRKTPCEGWLYTGALENYPDLVDRMAQVRPLLGNDGGTLRTVRSPERLADVLQSAGLLFPETRSNAEGLSCDGSWLKKSCRGSSGNGVSELTAVPPKHERGVFYQRHVAGKPCSAVFVGHGQGCTLLGVTRQLVGEAWTGASDFQYCGSMGPLLLEPSVNHEIARIGDALAVSFGLLGLFGVDLVIAGSEVWTIEVNPRYTAAVEIVERASGIGAIDAHIAGCSNQAKEQRTAATEKTFVGKAIVFCKQPAVFTDTRVQWALKERSLADIPRAGTQLALGQPVLTTFAEAESIEGVEQELRRGVAEVYKTEGGRR